MDDIVDIAFTDVSVISNTTSQVADITGSVTVDYTTEGVVSGDLTVSVNGVEVDEYTNFFLNPVPIPPNYTVIENNFSLGFNYIGQQPTSLDITWMPYPNQYWFPLTSVVTSTLVICYAAGTLIRTPRGDVPVESLNVGDFVLTSSGQARPIKWIGHRDIDCRRDPNRRAVQPVRIAAGAFGPEQPSQDLFVSPGHAICVDACGESLIAAGDLVNGSTVACVEADMVSYWHVELDSHDILIANNLPAESYLDMGNRAFFAEAGAALDPFWGRWKTRADFCRPFVSGGPILAYVRDQLRTRADALGWTPSREADLHLVVDGWAQRPLAEGGEAAFLFPASARDVRLKSKTFVPALVGGDDPRTLGASLLGLVISGRGGARPVALDDERLGEGCHAVESNRGRRWRWTRGELVLDPTLWAGLTGQVALQVTCDDTATRGWIAPSARASATREAEQELYAAAPILGARSEKNPIRRAA